MTKIASLLRSQLGMGGKWWRSISQGRRGTRRDWGRGRGERCGYEETGAMPVVVIDEEKEKALKIWYMTLHAKLFGASQK